MPGADGGRRPADLAKPFSDKLTVEVATLDTAKAFNASAFGPLQFRIVRDGVPGDWRPLAVLVRLPTLHELRCARGAAGPCELVGANLFLIDSVAGERGFDRAVKVPEGFPGHSLQAPRPTAGRLYLKLHDAPDVVNWVSLQPARAAPAPGTKPAEAKAEGER